MSENKIISDVLSSVKNAADGVKSTAIKIKDNAAARQAEIKENIADKKRTEDMKKYSPIFAEDVANGELLSERVIRIVNYDARLENDTCKDSIGFYEKSEDRKMPTFYSKYISMLGLTLRPQQSDSVYISDPCVPGTYIEIDEYYNHMKEVRVNELTVLAQALGAKSVTIKLQNATRSLFHKGNSANVAVSSFSAEGEKKESKKESRSIEIWSTTTFKTSIFDGSPVLPELMYFRNESDISALIQMVTVNKSKLTTRTYSMKASTSSGVSLNEAASISGMLKKIKCKAGANFEKTAEKENSALLKYTIEF